VLIDEKNPAVYARKILQSHQAVICETGFAMLEDLCQRKGRA